MFCDNEIHVLSSKKKIEFIKPLEEVLAARADLPKLRLYTRNKVSRERERELPLVDGRCLISTCSRTHTPGRQ